MPSLAIAVEDLAKRFGPTEALRGVSFTVGRGEIFSLLGRNGSGKTTTVRVLTGLTAPSSGKATVLDHDVAANPAAVQARIGVTLQEAALDELLSGRELLQFVGAALGMGRTERRRRSSDLLDLFGLSDAADRPIGTYSGGMQRRVDLAAALVRQPELLFLDEPTTGLDPQNRRALWAEIARLRDTGTTVFLTTQYLEEAEALADRIAIVHLGRLLDSAAPQELRARHGRSHLAVEVEAADRDRAASVLATAGLVDRSSGRLSVGLADAESALPLLRALGDSGVRVTDVEIRRDSLEDVFIHLTGEGAASTEPVAPAVVGAP